MEVNKVFSRITLREFSSAVLAAVLLVSSTLVSLTFTLTIATWIASSGLVLAIRIHRGSRKPPYHNGRIEFETLFRKWMKNSALWAVVGGAILTLVVDYPSLGLTGILLGAVFLRRVQQVVPDLVPLIFSTFDSRRSEEKTSNDTPQKIATSPYAFLTTRAGQRLLNQSLRESGFRRDNWQVVGTPDTNQLTLALQTRNSGDWIFARFFGTAKKQFLEHEYTLRMHRARPPLFLHSPPEKGTLAGLETLLLRYPPGVVPPPGARVSNEETISWQLEWEMRCVQSQALQSSLSEFGLDNPTGFLLEPLIAASRIRGPHTEVVANLLSCSEIICDRYLDGPRVIHFGGPVVPHNLVALAEDRYEPLNVTRWGVGLLGAHWGDSNRYREKFEDLFESADSLSSLMPNSELRHRVKALTRALGRYDFLAVASHGTDLLKLLRS